MSFSSSSSSSSPRRVRYYYVPRPPIQPPSASFTVKDVKVPPDILELIITCLLPPAIEIERTDSSKHASERPVPNSDIFHVCQTSRVWYHAAIRLLYYRVVLCTEQQMKKFKAILTYLPSYQTLVRHLVLFDDALTGAGSDLETAGGLRGWYFRTITKPASQKQADRRQELARAIVTVCKNVERLSFHCSKSAKFLSIFPYVLESTGIGHYGRAAPRQLLISSPWGYWTNDRMDLSNIQIITFLGNKIEPAFFIRAIGTLPRLHTLTLIKSFCADNEYTPIYHSIRKVQSLRVLQLVECILPDRLTPEQVATHHDACPCPENLERLSIVHSGRDIDSLLAGWSSRGGFSETLQELCISMSTDLSNLAPAFEFPSTLATLRIFFVIDVTSWGSRYGELLKKTRRLLENNRLIASGPKFKSLIVGMEIPADEYHVSEVWRDEAMEQECLLQDLCDECDVKLSKVYTTVHSEWFLRECEGEL